MKNLLKKISDAIKTYRIHKSMPLHIEFNLTDHCNLNCKGCSHYSPLAPDEQLPLSGLENSMRRIAAARNASMIKEIYLIGGETLLYRDLEEAMALARRHFPKIPVKIFTNGLLIPKMKPSFWEACRRHDCTLAITRYPVKFDYDNVADICRRQGVKTMIFGDRSMADSFFRFPLDPTKGKNPRLAHFRCTSFGCVTVDNGRIFPCSQSACIRHVNNRFGTQFRWEEGDFIEVDRLNDIREIIRLRNNPVPFCAYCGHTTTTPYGPSRRTAEEWIDSPRR